MNFAATGIVTNEFNEILLIQRTDSKTWAAPGGGIESGELPSEAAAREVFEETMVNVTPVRLAAATFWAQQDYSQLHLIFRCLHHGDKPKPTAEALQVGFFKANALPKPMRQIHQKRIDLAVYHTGPAVWETLRPTVWQSFRRTFLNFSQSPASQRQKWTAESRLVVVDEAHRVALNKQNDLPGGRCAAREAPWETVPRLAESQIDHKIFPERLSDIFVSQEKAQVTLVFRASKPAGFKHHRWVKSSEINLPVEMMTADDDLTRIEFGDLYPS